MEGKEIIKIIMDHREVNPILKQALIRDPSVKLEISTLKTGDFLINGLLLIERKTFSDFVASIKDGRIFHQASRLSSASVNALIILEGTLQDVQSTNMKREAIQGVLACLSLKFRIPILRSMSADETSRLMLLAYKQLADSGHHHKKIQYRPGGHKKETKQKQQIFILQGFPGIGPAKAKLLLDRFGSLKALFSASVLELTEVNGIGKYTAQQLYSTLGEERPS
jgi:DNA excision repair protein ERCC-4